MTTALSLLQVEDSESDASLIVRLLEKAGYDVEWERVETDGQMRSALAKRAWDAIVADYHLPVGRGTRIEVLLPVPKTVQGEPAAVVHWPVPAAAYGTVLIVDDEPMVRKMAGTLLKKRGIPVLEASTGKEAIELLASEGAAVRAILLDMAMPEMAGDIALPVIRKLRPDVRVIVSSGYQDDDVQRQFARMEVCGFLPKPYTREQLLTQVLPAVCRGEAET